MSFASFRNFKPAGPVAAAFIADNRSDVATILGPVGAGKSVSCVFKLLKLASDMPICVDGKIHFKAAVIGSTYGQLERNLYPTWKQWLPEDGGDFTPVAEWVGGGGRSAEHKLSFDIMRDGKRIEVDFRVVFAAIGEQSVEQFMRGFEPTVFWLYEMDQLPDHTLENASGRLGRYPNASMLSPGSTGYHQIVIGDLNAPDVDSEFYRTFEEDRPEGVVLYRQPGGRDPKAENLQNLPKGYYERLIRLNRKNPIWILRFVDAQYAPSQEGEVVYPEYSDTIHLSPVDIEPIPNSKIYLGLDQGLRRPAAVIAQRKKNGQWLLLGECMPGRMSARRFAQMVQQEIVEVFALVDGCELEVAYADPAGFSGADKEDDEYSWAEQVSDELGVPVLPTESNEIGLRLDAVKEELTHMIDSQTPGLLISKRCRHIRKGFASHYYYKVEKVAGTAERQAKPYKNDYANLQDGLQYLLLGVKGKYAVIAGRDDEYHDDIPEHRRRNRGRSRSRNTGSCTVVKSNYIGGV